LIDALLNGEEVPVIVQGATGRAASHHLDLMRRYGTRIVGGVSPSGKQAEIAGVPVFSDCTAAVRATGARASVIMVPPLAVLPAIEEAIGAGVALIVAVTEGMPVRDAMRAAALARAHQVTWIGPSTPGLAIPGRVKLGFLPEIALRPGPLAVMSKSGTLSYEICHRLVRRGIGQSIWVGVGGDTVKGTRFADLVPVFEAHRATRAVLVVGEIGGNEEEELADALRIQAARKPYFVVLAGSHAREGVTMGHAGALIDGAAGALATKIAALEAAGALVFARMEAAIDEIARHIGPWHG
jgi:succinyl-CoA synthetase alpha subunit